MKVLGSHEGGGESGEVALFISTGFIGIPTGALKRGSDEDSQEDIGVEEESFKIVKVENDLSSSEKSPMFGELQDILVEASSLAGLPGVSLPCGFTKNNLPVGMQIIGPQFSEELLFKVGNIYQQLTNHHKKRPSLSFP